jgi:hypothetical protein
MALYGAFDIDKYLNKDQTSQYNFGLIKHPVSGLRALVVEDTTDLPSVHVSRLTSEETMTNEGWFEIVEV